MKIGRFLLIAAVASAGPAVADPRITTHLYQSGEVVEMHGRTDTQSAIAFASGERIENIAIGDSASWQVAPNKRADLVFLKPLKASARTNMTVVTDQHIYLFDLVSAGSHGAPVYMLRFTYPAAPPIKPVAFAAEALAATAPIPAPSPEPDPADLNFAWATHGDKALLPSRLFDDGHSTFLAWPKEVPLPAILTSEANGAEGPVNYVTRGEYIVVDGVPAQLVLRSGKRMATLTPTLRAAAATAVTAADDRLAANRRPASRPFAHALDGQP